MSLNEHAQLETHCIKVTKFTDWTYQLTKSEFKENILKNVDFKTIIEEIKVPCGKPSKTVWKIENQFTIGVPAKVSIYFEDGCDGEMQVGINDKPQCSINKGECETFEVEYLKSIEIGCDGKDGDCTGLFEIEFKPDLFVNWLHHAEVQCFFSDVHGNIHGSHKLPPIKCTEVKQQHGRDSISLTLPDWNTISLQRVKILKKGFIILKFVDNHYCIFTTKPIVFNATDNVLLTAPKQTMVKCTVLEGDCHARVKDKNDDDDTLSFEVLVSLSLYQKIMTVEKVFLEVEGRLCKPRKDL
ncbi:BMQ_0737 family morphogenetic spore coat protein [Bacillus timonensis]|uniref:S-Ena type endospore appendage n=1 Tax=Bacillus timonensis TaxID=1033734 RepID=UPI000289610E|nr:S-Ena type endospore appendage [Bacillus timonensis]